VTIATPSRISLYPGASGPEGSVSSNVGGKRSGSATFRSADPVARVLEYYERSLKAAGMEVSKTTFTAQGSEGGVLNGNSSDPERTVGVMVGEEDGETAIRITYSEAGG